METAEEVVDTSKMMKTYSTLSANKLKETTLEAFKKKIDDDVKTAQEKADQIVNALTSKQTAPDFDIARGALLVLVKSHGTIVRHWQPFVESVNELLPPMAEGALVIPDGDLEKKQVELRELIDSIITPLPVVSGAELRVAFDEFSRLGEALSNEMVKRGLMPDVEPVIAGLRAEAAAAKTEREAAQRTRDEMAQAADAQVKRSAELAEKLKVTTDALDATDTALKKMTADLDAEMKRNTDFELKLTDAKKRAGELEHEVEQLKKKSKSK